MSSFTMGEEGIKIEISVNGGEEDLTKPAQPKTSDAKESEKGLATKYGGAAKQALGYLPGGSEAVGAISQAKGLVTTIGGISSVGGGIAALAPLVMSALKQIHDLSVQYVKDQRQSKETGRRAGFNRRQY